MSCSERFPTPVWLYNNIVSLGQNPLHPANSEEDKLLRSEHGMRVHMTQISGAAMSTFVDLLWITAWRNCRVLNSTLWGRSDLAQNKGSVTWSDAKVSLQHVRAQSSNAPQLSTI